MTGLTCKKSLWGIPEYFKDYQLALKYSQIFRLINARWFHSQQKIEKSIHMKKLLSGFLLIDIRGVFRKNPVKRLRWSICEKIVNSF